MRFLNKFNYIQFFTFGFVGVINTLICFAVYILLFHAGVHYIIANILGWIIAMTGSFFMNRSFVFKSNDKTFPTKFKFFSAQLFLTGISSITLFIFAKCFLIDKIIAQILSIGVTAVLNYTILNRIIFHTRY